MRYMDNGLNKDIIMQKLVDSKSRLHEFGVEEIGLFGSFVRDEATESSDIDLLVNIKKERKTYKNFMALYYYLEQLFNRRIELVTKQSLSPYIGPHILNSVEYASI